MSPRPKIGLLLSFVTFLVGWGFIFFYPMKRQLEDPAWPFLITFGLSAASGVYTLVVAILDAVALRRAEQPFGRPVLFALGALMLAPAALGSLVLGYFSIFAKMILNL